MNAFFYTIKIMKEKVNNLTYLMLPAIYTGNK